MPRSVLDLKIGETGKIISLTDPEVARAMLAMGILPLREIKLIRMDPFGYNLYLQMDSHSIAIRKSEAVNIIIA